MNRDRVESAARAVITAVVAGIGGAAGFTHTHAWALANGQTGWLAWADAVVIESMAVVAGLRLRPGEGGRRPVLPLVVLVAAFVLQMAAQVALAPRTPAGWLLAGVPALGFLVIVKLVLHTDQYGSQSPSPDGAVAHVEVERVDVPEIEAPVVVPERSSELVEPQTSLFVWPPRR